MNANRLLILLGWLAVLGCRGDKAPPPIPAPSEGGGTAAETRLFEDREDLSLRRYRGRVVVMALGRVGCNHSQQLFKKIMAVGKENPEGAVYLILHARQGLTEAKAFHEENPSTLHVVGDPSGKITDALPSQVSPSLFLFGKWGKARYIGEYEPDSYRSMTAALKAEVKPDPANSFLVTDGSGVKFFLLGPGRAERHRRDL
jgi:hypothetical protein